MQKKEEVKIWVDDIREIPDGYIGTKSVDETIKFVGTPCEYKKLGGQNNELAN